jgi:4-amino-4-deoxy-L-arabinose transferase-like glycosyltransferase
VQVERLWTRRLRWRMRGAWQWPLFVVLTVIDAIVLRELPFYDRGPGDFSGALLVAGFANLVIVALFAPVAGLVLRRRRRDLPRLIASDYAGAFALGAVSLLFVVGGLLHRPAVVAAEAEIASVAESMRAYVLRSAPEYRTGLDSMTALQLEDHFYRACVPGPDPTRALCAFVKTGQRQPSVTRDPDETPNSTYRFNPGPR